MSASLKVGALGLGLRPQHYAEVCVRRPSVDYFEVIADNFLSDAPGPLSWLDRVREHYPIVLHGVGLNLLGHEALDLGYVESIARLADRVDAPFVTDHLCWSGAHGMRHHDLLPVPYTASLLDLAAERASKVQTALDRPFGLENLSSYAVLPGSTMTEWEFFSGVVRAGAVHTLLDINNVFVSSQNHGFDPHEYLRAIDFSRVLQIHLAGHQALPDGTLLDTHDHPTRAEVLALFSYASQLGGAVPTMVEWDAEIPPLDELLAELVKVRAARP